jgi:hypothetical protein
MPSSIPNSRAAEPGCTAGASPPGGNSMIRNTVPRGGGWTANWPAAPSDPSSTAAGAASVVQTTVDSVPPTARRVTLAAGPSIRTWEFPSRSCPVTMRRTLIGVTEAAGRHVSHCPHQ